ncbi:MAG TPA: hypothetical protein VN228_09135 [Pyrinomonadaceae bacterium]|nr:hypothetical protein [Pyrinomonadaceae bacterium]
MFRQRQTPALAAIVAALVLALASPAAAQKNDKSKNEKEPKAPPTGTPVLWQERDAASLDLFYGPGGEANVPDLSNLTFIKEEKGGWSKKYRVKDAKGRTWVAKVGREAQSETAATRLVWAAGYMTEITYLAPSATIPTVGAVENVRFELRPEGVKRHGMWSWSQNPFSGKRELQALKTLMILLNNWDMKDENNVLMTDGGPDLRYAISDLGATLGKTGSGALWTLKRSRNDPEGFSGDKFVKGVKAGGVVEFDFTGKNTNLLEDITVEQARWAGQLLSRLSDKQLNDAFRAANYTPAQISQFTAAIRGRINELVNLRAGASASR